MKASLLTEGDPRSRLHIAEKRKTKIYELELVNRLKSGDVKSISALYNAYAAAIFGIIIRIVKVPELSEDVLQLVFVKIWKSISQYDPSKGALYTWMAIIANNKAIDQLRSSESIKGAKNESLNENIFEVESVHYTVFNTDLVNLKSLLSSLKIREQRVMELIYFEGYIQSEVAHVLEIPIGTVKTNVRTAIKKLKKICDVK